ncbi:MAG TPA: DNA polymerase I, partial [Dehalococcoidia bacterium]|nr:DNA polymerase I [Dehalococcoidia bacterium]
FGLEPPQIVDLKGLKGDPSDNIPGVPGIGEKTAVKLLQEFGSIDQIYARIDDVKPARIQQLLRDHEAQCRRSRDLARIETGLDLQLDLQRTSVTEFDRAAVVEFFRDLEFSSLIVRLPKPDGAESPSAGAAAAGPVAEPGSQMALFDGGAPPPPPTNGPLEEGYRVVRTEADLDRLVDELQSAELISFDLETTSPDAMRAEIVGLSFSSQEGEAAYVPVGHRPGSWEQQVTGGDLGQLPYELVATRLAPLLAGEGVAKVAHNAKYDVTVLEEAGWSVKGLAADSMIAAYLLSEMKIGLKELAFQRLGVEMTPITELIGTGSKQKTMAEVPIEPAGRYACADADLTLRLWRLLESELRADPRLWSLFTEVEMPLVPVLTAMERAGVAVDTEFLREMSQRLGARGRDLEAEIYDAVGHQFNINSTQQLGQVLFQELHLPSARRTKGGQFSTDQAVLEELRGAHPIVDLLLEYRQITKLKSTYADALPALINPRTGRIHTSFNQTVATTGRLSSSDPNLQNIPARTEEGRLIRQAFVARGDGSEPYYLLSADYSQIELRILAHITEDPSLLASFAAQEDIHASTASQVFGVPIAQVTPNQRRIAKVVNFGVAYGLGEHRLAQQTDLSRKDAADFIRAYFERYRGIREYIEGTKRKARERGYVETLLGRRRRIPEINSANGQLRAAAERFAINMPIQGSAADIIKLAMIRMQRELTERRLRSKMILQVHDELVFEAPESELDLMRGLVPDVMSGAFPLKVPMTVEVKAGVNWNEMR